MGAESWAAIAEWVGAIGTIAALVVLIVQLKHERAATADARRQTERSVRQTEEALELQRERDVADREERDRAQAAFIWCHAQLDANSNDGVVVTACNGSTAPIFDAQAFMNTTTGAFSLDMGEPLLPGDNPRRRVAGAFNPRAPVGQFCGITFRDNAGMRWIKWGDGKLRPGLSADVVRGPTDTLLMDRPDPRDDW